MSVEMISVKQSLDRLDRADRLFQLAVNCYLSLLDAVDKHTLPVHAELEREFHERLRNVRKRIAQDPDETRLEESRRALDQELEEYARRARSLFRRKTEEVGRILLILAEATEVIQIHTGSYSDRFRQIAGRLETVAELQDLNEIRRVLCEQVVDLNREIETMHVAGRDIVARMQAEVDAVRRQLEQAERLAETDPLTGLLNRRGMEKRLEAAIAAGQRFSIVLFDLDRFKAVNDRHGHSIGDELLKSFAGRLSSQFRPGDFLARWGGDEFLALMPCELKDAVSRGRRIAQSACGSYTVRSAGREVRIEVSVSVGVAEHKTGQAASELIGLADKLMYQSKNAPTAGPPVLTLG